MSARAPPIVAISIAAAAGTARGSSRTPLCNERRRLDLREQVERVVARGAIGAEAHQDTGAQHVWNRGDAARELQIAARVVDHARTGRCQEIDLLAIDPDTVGGDQPAVHETEVRQVADRRATVTAADVAILLLGLGQMRDDKSVEPLRERVQRAIKLGPHGVGRVGSRAPVRCGSDRASAR